MNDLLWDNFTRGRHLPFDQALKVEKRCVCSMCWGALEATCGTNHSVYNVHCTKSNDQCSGTGFVSKRYVAQRLSDSFCERTEVFNIYGKLFGLVNETAEEAIRALGF